MSICHMLAEQHNCRFRFPVVNFTNRIQTMSTASLSATHQDDFSRSNCIVSPCILKIVDSFSHRTQQHADFVVNLFSPWRQFSRTLSPSASATRVTSLATDFFALVNSKNLSAEETKLIRDLESLLSTQSVSYPVCGQILEELASHVLSKLSPRVSTDIDSQPSTSSDTEGQFKLSNMIPPEIKGRCAKSDAVSKRMYAELARVKEDQRLGKDLGPRLPWVKGPGGFRILDPQVDRAELSKIAGFEIPRQIPEDDPDLMKAVKAWQDLEIEW